MAHILGKFPLLLLEFFGASDLRTYPLVSRGVS